MADISLKEREEILKKMSGEAQKVVSAIIEDDSKAESVSFIQNWQIALKLRDLAEDKEKYGPDALEQARLVLGRGIRWAEQRVAIARKFDEATILEYAKKRDSQGLAFSWSHLEFLALAEAKQLRKSLVSLWARDSIPTDAFGELVRARIQAAKGADLETGEDGEAAEGDEGDEGASVTKTPLRAIKAMISAIDKTVKSFDDIKKLNYKKLPRKDREELIKLNQELATLLEIANSINSRFPVEEIQQSIDDEEQSAQATLGDDRAKKTGKNKEAKVVKAPKPVAESNDDGGLFGDVGDDPAPTDPAALVPVHPNRSPNRKGAKAPKKKTGKQALATTGPGKDRRR